MIKPSRFLQNFGSVDLGRRVETQNPIDLLSRARSIAIDSKQSETDSMAREIAIAKLLLEAFNSSITPINSDDIILKFASSHIVNLRYGLMVAGYHLWQAGETEKSSVIKEILIKDIDPEISYIASQTYAELTQPEII